MSGRGVLRCAGATVPNRLIAEAVGRGFFQHPSSQQQQQSNLVPSSNGSDAPYPLNDLTLEGVKFHLSSMESIFLAPISDRFGSIRVPQRRLSLSVADVAYRVHQYGRFEYQHWLIIQNKQGATMAQYRHMSREKLADLLVFIMDSFAQFHQITVCIAAPLVQHWSSVRALCVAVEESGPIVVRSFFLHNRYNDTNNSQPLCDLIKVLAPTLRHLMIENIVWQQDWPLAIGTCQQLRSLDLQWLTFDYGDGSTRALLDVLGLLLPHLSTFHVCQQPTSHNSVFCAPLMPAKRSLILDSEWWLLEVHKGHLQVGDGWMLKNFLQRISTFTIPSITKLDLHARYLMAIDYIISSMTAPLSHSFSTNTTPHVIIRTRSGEGLRIETAVLLAYLLLASRYRVIITLKSRHRSPTLDEIAAITGAVADNNADNNNATIHGLDLPIQHLPQAQTFSFFGGGSELRLRWTD